MHQVAARDGAPDAAVALDAYLRAREWLDDDHLPPADAPAASVELPGISGVCVVLRLDGRFVAVGADTKGDPLMLRRAMGQAVAKALGDEVIRRVRADAGDRVTARLSLEVELAGPLVPLLGRTIADAAARVVPGRDGIAVRRGDQSVHAFPSRMAVIDAADRPSGTITALLVDAGLPPKDLNEYATEERVTLARFATVRMRADTPRGSPSIIERGGRTVEPGEVRAGATTALATRLVARLAAQAVSDPSGARTMLRGTFDPTRGEYDPAFATPRQAAMAAFALARAAQSAALPTPVATKARDAARALVQTLAALPDTERAATVDSLCAIAGAACLGGDDALRTTLATRARAEFERLEALGDAANPAAAALSAVAMLAVDPGDGPARAQAVVRRILAAARDKPAMALQAALPLALLARGPALESTLRDEVRDLLGKVASQLATMQVGADPEASAGMPGDLIGGLMPPNGPRYRVEADGLIHLAALAIARTDGHDAMRARSVRFLTQLVADDPWVGGFRRSEDLRGLVRGSLAGDDCPPDALVFGVLLATADLGDI